MATRIQPPIFNSAKKTYEHYKQELLAWQKVTDVPKSKQGLVIYLSLPDEDEKRIKEKISDEVELSDLEKDDGLHKLIKYMDSQLKKDDLEDQWAKYNEFHDYYRAGDESVEEFINKFDTMYNKLVKCTIILPPQILAFSLLKKSNISEEECLLVMSGMNYEQIETLYEQAKKSLRKFKGDSRVRGSTAGDEYKSVTVKQEVCEAMYAGRQEEAFYSSRGRGQWRRGTGGNWKGSEQNWRSGRFRGQSADMFSGAGRSRGNRGGSMSRMYQGCFRCGSMSHFVRDCPHTTDDCFIVLYTNELSVLSVEAQNSAVLDTACTSTVCGERWLKDYLETLNDDDKECVKWHPGSKRFKFGSGQALVSRANCLFPAYLVGKRILISTDVVESDIPLLLSKSSMKAARVMLDLENDMATILGVTVALDQTSAGHYCVPITAESAFAVESVMKVDLEALNDQELHKSFKKLHRQFAHPSEKKLKELLKDAEVWKDEYTDVFHDVCSKCDVCKRYATTPPRPVVAIPLASEFNEVVCMDLKIWNGQYILHLIDAWSRYSVSVPLKTKKAEEVIDQVMKSWIGVFGTMNAVLSDNGGEFNNELIREVASMLGVELLTTAAYSPWSNGLCERVHAVIDTIIAKLREENPGRDLETLLRWANFAKNSLHMNNGFSCHQLVFGRNPRMPDIVSATLPTLEGKTSSEKFASHLNALHSARREFIKANASEKIRRALRSKVRAAEQRYDNGDKVFYKREGKERWMGPGTVLFQDGKTVWVRHGGVFVKVSPNRLMKVVAETASTPTEDDVVPAVPQGESQDQCRLQEEFPATDMATDNPGDQTQTHYPINQPQTEDVEQQVGIDNVGDNSDYFHDVPRRSLRLFNRENNASVYAVHVPRALHKSDECVAAKLEELDKLKEFEVFEEVPYNGQSCVATRWVLTYKGEKIRARLVAKGFQEHESMRVDSPTVGKPIVRLTMAIAASKGWQIQSTDVKSAFLQGNPPDRDIFVIPPVEASASDSYVWKLKKSLYGLNDAARSFHLSLVSELKKLGCVQSGLDNTLFYLIRDNELQGVIVSHVDDLLHAGSGVFEEEVMMPLRQRFIMGRVESQNFRYVGLNVSQSEMHEIEVDLNHYLPVKEFPNVKTRHGVDKTEELNGEEYSLFRSMVGAANWMVMGTRPDVGYDVLELSTKSRSACVGDLRRAEKMLHRLSESEANLLYPCLGPSKDWSLVLFADASHANLPDGVSSTLGYVIFLVGVGRSCPLAWRSGKIQRVVRSSLAAETMALVEGIEEMLFMRKVMSDLGLLTQNSCICYVDSHSLCDAVYSTKMTGDKRLQIDIAAVKQFVAEKHVDSVRWISNNHQLANCLTKRGASSANLLQVLQSGSMEVIDM